MAFNEELSVNTKMKQLMVLVLGLLASTVLFATTKVGVVNIQEVIKNMPEREKVLEVLKKELNAKQAKLSGVEESIKKLQEKIERDKAILSAKELEELKDNFVNLQRDFARKKNEFQDDLAQLENKEMQKIFKKAADAIDTYAKANGYDLIIRRDAAPFYISSKVDITDAVVKNLNK